MTVRPAGPEADHGTRGPDDPPELTDYFRQLLWQRHIVGLCRAGAAATRIGEAAAARTGRNLTQFLVLGMLDATGPRSQQELSDGLRTDRTTMVGTVDALERAGLVTRQRNPTNRRAYIVTISPAGRAALATISADAATLETRFFERLTADERNQLVGLIGKLLIGADAGPTTG